MARTEPRAMKRKWKPIQIKRISIQILWCPILSSQVCNQISIGFGMACSNQFAYWYWYCIVLLRKSIFILYCTFVDTMINFTSFLITILCNTSWVIPFSRITNYLIACLQENMPWIIMKVFFLHKPVVRIIIIYVTTGLPEYAMSLMTYHVSLMVNNILTMFQ